MLKPQKCPNTLAKGVRGVARNQKSVNEISSCFLGIISDLWKTNGTAIKLFRLTMPFHKISIFAATP